MNFIPNDLQGYIRHILHSIGVLIVAYGGANQEVVEIYVGLMVNLISLGWFATVTYMNWKQARENIEIKSKTEETTPDVSDDS